MIEESYEAPNTMTQVERLMHMYRLPQDEVEGLVEAAGEDTHLAQLACIRLQETMSMTQALEYIGLVKHGRLFLTRSTDAAKRGESS